MNRLLSIFAVILLALCFYNTPYSQSNKMTDRFYIGPMNFFHLEALRTQNHLDWYKGLSYNAMQNYSGHFDSLPNDWKNISQRDGGFFEDVSSYEEYARNMITQWFNLSGMNSLIFEREKILRPAFGQRSSYQAEDVGTWGNKLPAYGYEYSDFDNTHDVTENINGETVRSKRCIKGIDREGFLVKGLVENCEQVSKTDVSSANSNGWGRLYSDIKQPNYKNRWYIKPRMRIDPAFAIANPDVPVVMIYVYNFKGNLIDTVLISCRNFLKSGPDGHLTYDGSYIETYHNMPDERMSVAAEKLVENVDNPDNSKVDYQVKWLGKADVWLDYVRLDDSWAHFLFTDTYESELSNPKNPWKFHHKIKEEIDAFKDTPGLAYFWVDETNFNNIPCIAEVNKLVKKYSGGKYSITFISDPVAFVGNGGLRNKGKDWSVHWQTVYDSLFSSGAVSDLLICQFFPQLYWIAYPHTLAYDVNSPVEKFILKNSYDKYYGDAEETNWDGYITYLNRTIKLMRFVSARAKKENLTFGAITQLNSDEGSIRGKDADWGLREPTNEEICVTNYLAMCYGAKLILQFSYNTTGQGNGRYNTGLTSPDYTGRREKNYYGQLKWECLADLNKQMTMIGNVMYPPGNEKEHLVYENTATVNSKSGTGLPMKYVSDLKSIKRDASNNFTDDAYCSNCDPAGNRYWEIGFFGINLLSANQNDNTKYFLVLNKRTYPEINNNGDKRFLKIQFSTNELSESDKWELKNAVTGEVISTFSKSSEYISVGLFNPGEAKLFKLIPVK